MSTIIVTGASSGVGRGIALCYAEAGWTVCAIARNQERLEELASCFPKKTLTFSCDVSKADQVRSTFDAILEEFPDPDVLLNNAGKAVGGIMETSPLDIIDEGIDINLKGTMYCTGAVVPNMKKAGKGLIINIASTAGLPGGVADRWINPEETGYGTYGVAKAGMIFFSESTAKRLLPHGIRVTYLCPGGIKTPLWGEDHPYPDPEAKLITVDDMVDLVKFLVEAPNNILYKNVTLFPINEWK